MDAPFSFAADVYNCYPAEPVRFYLRPGAQPGSAQVTLPAALRVTYFGLLGSDGLEKSPEQRIYATEQHDGTAIGWEWGQEEPAGELMILTRVDPRTGEGALVGQAQQFDETGSPVANAQLRVVVKRYAESLNYLPELYHEDDFTNRFLMLFDSFWKPISQQIDHVPYYFDPYLTPPEFLPWLASWFGLDFFDGLPEARKRDLLAKIFPIYARKGTRQALVTCLKMFTGGEVQIYEHRDTNFVLGKTSRLGYQVALGTENKPHSFDVHVTVPASAIPGGDAGQEPYRKQVEALIGMYKPAHTIYHLELTFAQTSTAETETR